MNPKLLIAAAAALALALALAGGCDDERGVDHTAQSDAAHVCAHIVGGPAEPIIASADVASAPDATFEHTRVDVTLADLGDGTRGGFVKFRPGAAGEFVIFTTADVTLAVTDAQGVAVPLEERETDFADCAEAAVGYHITLAIGTYDVQVQPTALSEVSFVFYHRDGDHGHA